MSEPQPLDGRNAGAVNVNSVGAWTDLTAAAFFSVTDTALETAANFISLSVRETGGAAPCGVLLRANAGEDPLTDAWLVAANTGEGFDINLDEEVTTISIYGLAHVKVLLGK